MSEEIIQSMSLNKILVAILEENGSVTVPTSKFVGAQFDSKELVVDYDDDSKSFTFSLRSANEQQ
jgi:hypothetical protein